MGKSPARSTQDKPFDGMSAAEIGALTHGELCAIIEDMAALIQRQAEAIAQLSALLGDAGKMESER